MKFNDIVEALEGRVISKSSLFDTCNVESVIVSDLMSDVLTMEKPSPILVTSLSSEQTVRTASMVDALGVIIAQNKPLPEKISQLAADLDVAIITTPHAKFEVCVILGKLLEKDSA